MGLEYSELGVMGVVKKKKRKIEFRIEASGGG